MPHFVVCSAVALMAVFVVCSLPSQALLLELAKPCTDVIAYVGASCKRMLTLHVSAGLSKCYWDTDDDTEVQQAVEIYLRDKFIREKEPTTKVRASLSHANV